MEFRLFTLEKQGLFSPRYLMKENGEVKYLGKISSFLNKAQLYDVEGQLVMQVVKDWKRFKKIYDLTKDRTPVGLIHFKWGLRKDKITVESTMGDFVIDGRGKVFSISKEGEEVAKVSRKSSWSYEFGIAFRDEVNEELMIKMLLCIVLHIRLKVAAGAGA